MTDWSLVYDRFDPAEERLREALCTLGNGYFATRGAAEEAESDENHYPGTYLAAGYIGMVVGAALFAEVYPWFDTRIVDPLDLGKETLATITGIGPWIYLAAIAVVSVLLFRWFDGIERSARA